jgi:small-conductance mechanosensitive channel
MSALSLLLGLMLVSGASLAAQAQVPSVAQAPLGTISASGVERAAEPQTLTYFNRPIVVLRARILGRGPAERSAGASRLLDELVSEHITGPVGSRPFDGGVFISVGPRLVLALTPLDVDDLAGETMQGVVAQTIERLQLALNEATEARAPGVLLRATALATLMLAVATLALWGLFRARRVISARLVSVAEARVARAGIADVEALRASRVLDIERYLVTAVFTILDLVVVYAALTFVLRRFPFTRPWGESMRGFLFSTLENIALGVATAIPGLFTVFLIFLLARLVVRVIRLWFRAVERGTVRPFWLHPETAQPTRRLVSTLVWLFAIVLAYPYLPGSQSEAFKGVSVFIGLMITFGSSGLVNQIMSGFMVTYSRAVRVGDFVRIGDVEGTVTHLGVLSTKVKTLRQEEVTIPNAVVVSQTTTDYSRNGDVGGVFTPTSVTIGYDTPWRQVHALLLLAAERTPGLRKDPKPLVIQTALEDFYVKYTLFVCLERQQSRPETFNALHALIQDLFNEHGVQIMSPNYVLDPAAPKVVPRANWFAAPARPPDVAPKPDT